MWISSKIKLKQNSRMAEKGSVTLSKSMMEAGSTISKRDIESYAPYGYQSKAPVGQEVMLMPSSSGQVMIGALSKNDDLESGEIRLSSLGGATIVLKNDGTIMLNSLVIDENGVIKNDIQN